MLVDSHAHMDARLFDRDREQVVARAREAGIGAIINAGFNLESSRASLALATRYGEVFVAVGFHPHNASRMRDGDLDELAQLSLEPKVVAIGEIGLDFYRNLSPREVQVEAFERQLELAGRLGLPAIIHSRNAADEVFHILARWAQGQEGRPLGVLHCFDGDTELGKRYIELGFFLSIAGPVTYSSSGVARIAGDLPLERLLIETDCPFLTPVPYRGRRNEPANVLFIAQRIGELRGMAPDAVAQRTAENAIELFRLPPELLQKGEF